MSPLEKYRAMQAAQGGGMAGGPAAAMGGAQPLHSEQQEDVEYAKTHPVASGAALGPAGAEMQQMGDEQDENDAIQALLMRLGLS